MLHQRDQWIHVDCSLKSTWTSSLMTGIVEHVMHGHVCMFSIEPAVSIYRIGTDYFIYSHTV